MAWLITDTSKRLVSAPRSAGAPLLEAVPFDGHGDVIVVVADGGVFGVAGGPDEGPVVVDDGAIGGKRVGDDRR